ncbi:Rab3 GTPase-activating protein [Aureococcus anophagefferens]|nr:Rab3 GTPase-activating protein [Aureococcus anophagefferens]
MADDWPLAIAHGRVAYCAFRATSVTVAAVDGDEVRVVALGAVPEAASLPGLATFLAFDGGGAPRVSHHKVAAPEPAALAASRGGKALGVGSRPTVAEYALADPPPSGLLRAAAGALLGWLAPGARAPRGDGNARDGFADRRPYEDREGLREGARREGERHGRAARSRVFFDDAGREAHGVAVSPRGDLAAVSDNLGRVLFVDVAAGRLVRLFKGARRAQVAWVEVDDGDGAKTPGLYLAIFAPQRALARLAGGWGGAGDGLARASRRRRGARASRRCRRRRAAAGGPAVRAAFRRGAAAFAALHADGDAAGRAAAWEAALCAECFPRPPATATPLTLAASIADFGRALLAPLRSGDVLGARASRDAAAALGLDAPMLVDLTCVVFSNLPVERLRASASSGALARWLQALLPADGDCGPALAPLVASCAASPRPAAAAVLAAPRSTPLTRRAVAEQRTYGEVTRDAARWGRADVADALARCTVAAALVHGPPRARGLRAPTPGRRAAAPRRRDAFAASGAVLAVPCVDDPALARLCRDRPERGWFHGAFPASTRTLSPTRAADGAASLAASRRRPTSSSTSSRDDGEPQVLFDFKPKDDGEPQVMFDFKPKDDAADEDDWPPCRAATRRRSRRGAGRARFAAAGAGDAAPPRCSAPRRAVGATVDGATALHAAAGARCAECVAALLGAGADVFARDRRNETPLHRCCAGPPDDDAADVARLLSRHPPRGAAAGGSTRARRARAGRRSAAPPRRARGGEEGLEVVDALIEAGASPAVPDARGRSPLAVAAAEGDAALAVALCDGSLRPFAKAEESPAGPLPLQEAVRSGDAATVDALAASGRVDLDGRERGGDMDTALTAAARAGRDEAVRVLVDRGADVFRANGRQRTPLFLALSLLPEGDGPAPTVEVLARAALAKRAARPRAGGASFFATPLCAASSRTPLQHALRCGRARAAALFMGLGAPVDVRAVLAGADAAEVEWDRLSAGAP